MREKKGRGGKKKREKKREKKYEGKKKRKKREKKKRRKSNGCENQVYIFVLTSWLVFDASKEIQPILTVRKKDDAWRAHDVALRLNITSY